MKKIRFFPLLLLIILLFTTAAPSAFALDEPTLVAKAAVLVDMNSGSVLYSKNMDEQRSPASLTKIMTVLIAIEALESGDAALEDMVTAQADCRDGLDEESSTSGIVPGDSLSYKDLLYCCMLQSANEACNILASHLSGSVSAFVQRMNDRAAELGCENTHFANTNGLTVDGHYSSARDMSVIMSEALKHTTFVTIINTLDYQTGATSGSPEGIKMTNSNALINNKSIYALDGRYLYSAAHGGKTGYTNAAGYCLATTAEKDGKSVLAVVLGSNGPNNSDEETYDNFSDSIALYDWVFDNFSYRTLMSTSIPLERVTVALAEGDGVAVLRPQESVTALLPNDVPDDAIETAVTVYDTELTAPISANTVLGEVTVSANGVVYGTTKLVNSIDIDMSKSAYLKMRLGQIFSSGWVIVILVLLAVLALSYVILVVRYRRMRKKHLREKRRAEERRRAERERQYAHTTPPEPTRRMSQSDLRYDYNDNSDSK